MAISTIGASGLNSAVSQIGKNLIHNGAMLVDQKSADTRTGLGAADTHICDRWRGGANGSPSARWTISVETSGGPATGTRWLKCLNTTADASPGSAEAFTLRQALEAQNLQSLVTSGTLGAMTISGKVIAHADGASSISFPAKLACGVTTSDGTARQFYTDITFAAADTWTDFSITIPADGTATIDNNNGQGLNFQFGMYGGSGRVAATATWENDGADSITANSDNWADATNNYIGFTQIQIEAGTVATDFEHEDYGTTLAKCQRYLFRINQPASSYEAIGSGFARTATQCIISMHMDVPMRVEGTLSAGGTLADIDNRHAADDEDTTALSSYAPGTGVYLMAITIGAGNFTVGEGVVSWIKGGSNSTFIQVTSEL